MTAHDRHFEKATPIYNFSTDDGGRLGDKEYRYVRRDEKYQYWQRIGMPVAERFTHEAFAALLNDMKCPFEHLPRAYAEDGPGYDEVGNMYLGDLDERDQAVAEFKTLVVEKFLRMELNSKLPGVAKKDRVTRSDGKMTVALAQIRTELDKELDGDKKWSLWFTKGVRVGVRMPTPRTVRNWILAYEEDNSIVNFASRRGGPRLGDHFTAEESVILDSFVKKFASAEKPTVLSLHEKMTKRIEEINEKRGLEGDDELRVPCLRTFQNRVNKLNGAFVTLGRKGKGKASAEYRPLAGGMEITRAFQRLEMDEWRFDWQTLLVLMDVWEDLPRELKRKVSRERVYITAVVDYASKVLVGLRVHREAPSIMTVLATLEMACIDKTDIAARYGCVSPWEQCGKPETVGADSATWYANQAFRVTVNDLGSKSFLPPAGAASARGTIERFFRMSSGRALEFFSGRTFGSIEEKGDYDSEALAVLPFDEIAACLTRFYVDVYHNTPHDGLHGETPRDAWARLMKTHRLNPPPTGRRRRHVFGVNCHRVLGREGVRFLGIPYQSPALQTLLRKERQRVLIRVDRYDLGQISVWGGDGWVSVDAQGDDFKGMSVWTWRAACLELRKLNLSKAKLNRGVLRKAKSDLESKADHLRLVAGIDSPILTDEKFAAWEKEMDQCVEIVDSVGDVPGNFVENAVFAPEFYAGLGIAVVAPTAEKAAKGKASKAAHIEGWIDPRNQPDDDDVEKAKARIAKANRHNS